jgi:hypothetical protein
MAQLGCSSDSGMIRWTRIPMRTYFIYHDVEFEDAMKVIMVVEIADQERGFDPDRELQWQCNAENSGDAAILWADEMLECSDPFGNPHLDFQLSI